jgi:RND family efflux transporter MFP subunit
MNAVENSYISNSLPLVVIDGPDQMKIVASVSEALVPRLSIGDEATVSVSAIETEFTATIRNVEQSANAQTKLYTVTLTVPADVSGLLAGMFADVTFHTNVSEGAVVIPSEAILTSGSTQYVFVVEGDTAKYVEVTTGLTGSGVTEILTGLEPGAQLVTVGQAYLSDGDAVRIVTGED